MTELRVVVTGMGTTNPLGNSIAETWEALVAGKSGIATITQFDPTPFETQVAGEVKNFVTPSELEYKEARRIDRSGLFAVHAASEAIKDAGLPITEENSDDIAVVFGAGIGGVTSMLEGARTMETKGPRRVHPFAIPMSLVDMSSGQIAITFGIKGPNMAAVTACATGITNLGIGADWIRYGDVIAAVVGGTETGVMPMSVAGFNVMGVLSRRNDDPAGASRPFDATRDGLVLGEGSGCLILEELEHAKARGAHIYAEVLGSGLSADAVHLATPAQEGEGQVRAIRRTLRKSGLRPEEVDYINPHGASTVLGDKGETSCLKTVFGRHAYELEISSTKSMIGHLMGAAGAVEAIATVLTLYHGVIPPTINYRHPDPECDLDYVPNKAREKNVRIALSISAGFGGVNSAILF
ncbi:MAG: beta-ketoacyl-ACP synthase II, partial [Chloroflexota bacterium]|nr:beta-ketoacyl-ACP synthase II [Chloroflexota bacterium]